MILANLIAWWIVIISVGLGFLSMWVSVGETLPEREILKGFGLGFALLFAAYAVARLVVV